MNITIPKAKLKPTREALQRLEKPDPGKTYKLKNAGKVRYNLAKSYQKIEEAEKALDHARVALIEKHLADQKIELPEATQLDGKFLQSFVDDFNEVLKGDDELDLRQVLLTDLDLETNDIPFTVIGLLLDTVIHDDTLQTAQG